MWPGHTQPYKPVICVLLGQVLHRISHLMFHSPCHPSTTSNVVKKTLQLFLGLRLNPASGDYPLLGVAISIDKFWGPLKQTNNSIDRAQNWQIKKWQIWSQSLDLNLIFPNRSWNISYMPYVAKSNEISWPSILYFMSYFMSYILCFNKRKNLTNFSHCALCAANLQWSIVWPCILTGIKNTKYQSWSIWIFKFDFRYFW